MPVARLRKISEHVTALDMLGMFQVAVFFVRHPRGLVLIDAGFPQWHYAILSAVEGFAPPNRITHVLLTHAHADHVGSAQLVADATGAELLSSERERPFIEGLSLSTAGSSLARCALLQVNHWMTKRRVPVTRVKDVVREGDVLAGLRVVDVPGHTPGQIALVHETDRVVLCADALFNVRGEIGHDPAFGVTVDRALADASLHKLTALGLNDIVPSHGPAILGDAQARIQSFLASRQSRS